MDAPRVPIFEQVLRPLDLHQSTLFRGIVSAMVSALKREEHVLISCPQSIAQATVSAFIEHVVCSVFPATICALDSSGNIRRLGRRARKTHRTPTKGDAKDAFDACPFMSNICIAEDFHQIKDQSIITRVMKELSVTIGDEQESVPIPFIVFAIVPQNSHLPKSVVTGFSFHINIPTLPASFPGVESSLYQSYDALLQAMKHPVFVHKEVSIYVGRLILRADGTPLVTSFLDVKTKLLLNKAIEDCAILNGRNYVIPDDVQALFSSLVSHRVLLPGPTTFESCEAFMKSVIEATPVPV